MIDIKRVFPQSTTLQPFTVVRFFCDEWQCQRIGRVHIRHDDGEYIVTDSLGRKRSFTRSQLEEVTLHEVAV